MGSNVDQCKKICYTCKSLQSLFLLWLERSLSQGLPEASKQMQLLQAHWSCWVSMSEQESNNWLNYSSTINLFLWRLLMCCKPAIWVWSSCYLRLLFLLLHLRWINGRRTRVLPSDRIDNRRSRFSIDNRRSIDSGTSRSIISISINIKSTITTTLHHGYQQHRNCIDILSCRHQSFPSYCTSTRPLLRKFSSSRCLQNTSGARHSDYHSLGHYPTRSGLLAWQKTSEADTVPIHREHAFQHFVIAKDESRWIHSCLQWELWQDRN